MEMHDWIEKFSFFQRLKKLPFVDEIWGYGSRARGDHQARSDIDLAMVCPQASSEEWKNIQDILEEADTLLKIDCVRFDILPKGSEFWCNIMRDKKVLFRREKKMVKKIQEKMVFLKRALLKLEEMINEPVDKKRAQIDSSIQRFEFTFELFWKTLRLLLEEQGQQAAFPKEVLKFAYQGKLIHHQQRWLDMLKDRNETSHVYDESIADQIYHRIKEQYFKELWDTYMKLEEKLG
ncbi:MAG: nucleotidyltransferase substrate binding protein [Gammaproteobacteria bacterium]|nr:nucleotidyltransferase substrate binding protein [Gammaproteobacteria bacterium]